MNKLLTGIKLGALAAGLALIATPGYGATLAYNPNLIIEDIEPGQEKTIPLTVKLIVRVRGTQLLWFMSDVANGNLPMDWLSVLPERAFIRNSSPEASTVLSIRVPQETPTGVYSGYLKSSGMGAHSVLDPGEGLPITVNVRGGCSQLPEFEISPLNPETIWPPNHNMTSITVSGAVVMDGGCSLLDLFYSVEDEYGVHTHTGNISAESDHSFTVAIPVEAWRKGSDKDGRHYTILIFAKNEAGTSSSMNLQAVVPHDQRKK